MSLVLGTLKKILFWSYERGSWQYDVMCVLILAFIFLMPNGPFRGRPTVTNPVFVSGQEVEQTNSSELQRQIDDYLSRKYGHRVSVSRVEKVVDDSGNLTGYLAWEK